MNGKTDTIFVDVKKHPDIAYNILKSTFYRMEVSEVNTAAADLLGNGFIYTYIDFSDTYWFDYMSFMEKSTLENNLIKIIKIMGNDPGLVYPPRLRFASYNDPDNFVLVSDNKVKSPLAATFETTPNKLEGLSFTVENGVIYEYFGGRSVNILEIADQNNDVVIE